MRSAWWWQGAAVSALVAACGSAPAAGPDPAQQYLTDPAFRRSALEASLVAPGNGYSRLRLAHYDTGDAADWSRLPEWNPPAEPVPAAELDAPGGASATALSPSAGPLALPDTLSGLADPALLALGERAFWRYPTQLAPALHVGLGSRAAAARYGMWVDDARGVGGLVRAKMPDGSVQLELTCSTCHAARGAAGAWSAGLPAKDLAMGAALLDAEGGLLDPGFAQAIAAWGPGRLDVSTEDGTEPARIPDLRPARWLTYLQQDATVRARDVIALAVRLETLIVTSNLEAVRPPRMVVLGLAAYVVSLADGLPDVATAAAASPQGATLFSERCASCHAGEGMTGEPVPLATIGTDPTLGESRSRGTGTYRVPSLRGVGTRGPLLHDATVASVGALLEPSRTTADFPGRLHGPGPVPGHTYGLDLSPDDRAALAAYLTAL